MSSAQRIGGARERTLCACGRSACATRVSMRSTRSTSIFAPARPSRSPRDGAGKSHSCCSAATWPRPAASLPHGNSGGGRRPQRQTRAARSLAEPRACTTSCAANLLLAERVPPAGSTPRFHEAEGAARDLGIALTDTTRRVGDNVGGERQLAPSRARCAGPSCSCSTSQRRARRERVGTVDS